jgi:integrase
MAPTFSLKNSGKGKAKTAGDRFDSRTGYHGTGSKTTGSTLSQKKSDAKPDAKKKPHDRALLEELYQKLKPMFNNYKCLRLYDAGGDLSKDWFVSYYYRIPGTDTFKRIKERFDMNRIHSVVERRTYGKACVAFMKDKLQQGFNPFEEVKVVGQTVDFRIVVQLQKILNDISFNASTTAKASYQEHNNRFKKFIEARGLFDRYMVELNIDHAKQYKRWLLYEQDLAVKTVNASLSYMALYWENAIEKRWAAVNPFISVPRAKAKEKSITEETDERFEPLTADEMVQVFETLKQHNELNFIRFLAFIFYAWARPVEISRLRVSDIDMNRGLIRFRKGQTKNKKAAFVQIVPPLKKILAEMKLHEQPADWFLFSGDGAGFAPGRSQLTKYRAGERWRKYIKNETREYVFAAGRGHRRTTKGEGIKKDMYALKHTGNIEYLLQNVGRVDLKWQQMQNRHSSSIMTDRYNRKLGIYLVEVGTLNYKHFEI